MITLNVINGAQTVLSFYQMKLLSKFQTNFVGVEFGIAFGGGVEQLGSMVKGRGKVYGYDTFEDLHPDFLSSEKFSFEARCMDHWYDPKVFGTQALSYEFQRNQLDTEGLDNVILVKGLITKDSCKDLEVIHYALLDMDIVESMKIGYEAVIDKLAVGGQLFIHDALPDFHLPKINKWYEEIVKKDTRLKVIGEWPMNFLVGLERV